MKGLGVNLYPWDVAGDPAAAERVAGLGADRATLAAAYHTVRTLSPRHPHRKVVTATHSAVYYRPDERRWAQDGPLLRPVEAPWAPGAFTEAAAALRGAGLAVYAWTILAHNQRLGTLHPEHAVVNAFGDPYAWALCVNSPQVREYCGTLAAEVAAQPDVDGIELESCGWYGFDHLHAHDKTGGVAFDPAAKFLLNLCFCAACQASYAEAGIDGLRAAVRGALEPVFAGQRPTAALDTELLEAVSYFRIRAAATFQTEVVGAVRAARRTCRSCCTPPPTRSPSARTRARCRTGASARCCSAAARVPRRRRRTWARTSKRRGRRKASPEPPRGNRSPRPSTSWREWAATAKASPTGSANCAGPGPRNSGSTTPAWPAPPTSKPSER